MKVLGQTSENKIIVEISEHELANISEYSDSYDKQFRDAVKNNKEIQIDKIYYDKKAMEDLKREFKYFENIFCKAGDLYLAMKNEIKID